MGLRVAARAPELRRGCRPATSCVAAYVTWKGHEAHRRKPARLEGAADDGELGALDMGFMELGFALCCVIWTRPKKTMCQFWIFN